MSVQVKARFSPGGDETVRLEFNFSGSSESFMADDAKDMTIAVRFRGPYAGVRLIQKDEVISIVETIDLRDTLRDIVTEAIASLDEYYAKRGSRSFRNEEDIS